MSKSNTWENDLMKLLLQNVAATLIGDAGGLLPSGAAGSLYVSLHTADPGEAGAQTTSECAYAGYARVAVARTSGGWTVTSNQGSNTGAVTFGQNTGTAETATHFGLGTASSGGGGKLLYSGELLGPRIVYVADASTDVCTTAAAHGLTDGQAVRVRNTDGNVPTGLSVGTQYFIRDATSTTFKLCTTPGGAAVNITANGDGTNTVHKDNNVAIGTNITPSFAAGTLIISED